MKRERDEDVEHAEAVQRDVDERWETCRACEPWFDTSAFRDAAALFDVYLEGQAAGMRGASAGWNPNIDVRSPEYAAWERGRSAAEVARFNRSKAIA